MCDSFYYISTLFKFMEKISWRIKCKEKRFEMLRCRDFITEVIKRQCPHWKALINLNLYQCPVVKLDTIVSVKKLYSKVQPSNSVFRLVDFWFGVRLSTTIVLKIIYDRKAINSDFLQGRSTVIVLFTYNWGHAKGVNNNKRFIKKKGFFFAVYH